MASAAVVDKSKALELEAYGVIVNLTFAAANASSTSHLALLGTRSVNDRLAIVVGGYKGAQPFVYTVGITLGPNTSTTWPPLHVTVIGNPAGLLLMSTIAASVPFSDDCATVALHP